MVIGVICTAFALIFVVIWIIDGFKDAVTVMAWVLAIFAVIFLIMVLWAAIGGVSLPWTTTR